MSLSSWYEMLLLAFPRHHRRKDRHDFVFGDDGYDMGSPGRIEYEYDEMVVRVHDLRSCRACACC